MAAAPPPIPGPASPVDAIADRIAAALDRIEAAHEVADARQRALEAVVAGSIADLDVLLGPASVGPR